MNTVVRLNAALSTKHSGSQEEKVTIITQKASAGGKGRIGRTGYKSRQPFGKSVDLPVFQFLSLRKWGKNTT